MSISEPEAPRPPLSERNGNGTGEEETRGRRRPVTQESTPPMPPKA